MATTNNKSFRVSKLFDTLCWRLGIFSGRSTVCLSDVGHREVFVSRAWKVVIADILLGSALSILLAVILSPYAMADAFAGWRDQTKNSLESLLTWLMGAPAGLKLNSELAAFLGRLFLYHVYIWVEYLKILEPFIPLVVRVMCLSGLFGLSLMISFVYDVLNIITLHIHCFYVYAAKLYALQISALMSLARVFRGKKWNDLRLRVDSLSSDVDQLALATIIFTILLFLLPTTMLYYVVFVSLRIVTYHIQWVLGCMVKVLNTTIVIDTLLSLIPGTKSTKGGVEIELDWTCERQDKRSSIDSMDFDNSKIILSDVCTLKIRKTNIAVFGDIFLDLKSIFSGYSIKYVLISILQGTILELS